MINISDSFDGDLYHTNNVIVLTPNSLISVYYKQPMEYCNSSFSEIFLPKCNRCGNMPETSCSLDIVWSMGIWIF